MRDETRFSVGPSSMAWDDGTLVIRFNEIAVPRPPAQWMPQRISGTVRFRPDRITDTVFYIDSRGDHRWWPVAPSGRMEADFNDGRTSWRGHGYHDCNWGTSSLEDAFIRWDWARGNLPDGRQVILYDTERRDGTHECLSLVFGTDGDVQQFPQPNTFDLPRGFWGVRRRGHHDDHGQPGVIRTLEDGPFYMRSIVRTRLLGQPVDLMHESLSGDRFGTALVKLMLPFRMPRRR